MGESITITSGSNPCKVGDTLTIFVDHNDTGSGQLYVDGSSVDSQSKSGGGWTFHYTPSSPGTKLLQFHNYSGIVGAVGSISLVVNSAIATTTALTSDYSGVEVPPGATVTFTATVTPASGGTPTGTVTFKDGSTTLGTGALDGSGVATFSTSGLSAGNRAITAVYGGDSSRIGSTSSTLYQKQWTASEKITFSNTPTVGVACTVTVNHSNTGTTRLKVDGTQVDTDKSGNNSWSYTWTPSSSGNHTVTYNDWQGDSSYLTKVVNVVGSLTATTTTCSSDANPSASGASVTFSGTVSGSGGTPTGTVTIKDGAATLGTATLSGGAYSYSTSGLSVGSHSITAVYGGDGSFATSTSGAVTQVVKQATTTTLASGLEPSMTGDSVTFTATVTGSGGTPTGTVTFKNGGATLGTGTLSGGVGTLATNALAAGAHTITAEYAGDSTFAPSTSSGLTQHVEQAVTVTVYPSFNPSADGDAIAFSAVCFGANTEDTVTGTVTFKDGGATLGTVTLDAGVGLFEIDSLAVGSHTITARYNGDGSHAAANSVNTVTQHVYASRTALSTSSASVAAGDPVTFTALVVGNPLVGSPTGTVTFKANGVQVGSPATLTLGLATLTTNALTPGSYTITAHYDGDGNYGGFNLSDYFGQTVTPAKGDTTTALGTSVTPAALGAALTITATVTGDAYNGTPTGHVTFYEDTDALHTAALSGGSATFDGSGLAKGSHSLHAVYVPDTEANYHGSTSDTLTQVIKWATTTTLTTSPEPSNYGELCTYTATVDGGGHGTPTGVVNFNKDASLWNDPSLNGSGVASFQNGTIAAGAYSWVAAYQGDSDFMPSTSDARTTHIRASTSVMVSPDPVSAEYEQDITITVTLTTGATGTVDFKLNGEVIASGVAVVDSVAVHTITATLAAGSYTVRADYSGDSSHAPNYGTHSLTVNASTKAVSSVDIAFSSNPCPFGTDALPTVTVTGNETDGAPTGMVWIYERGEIQDTVLAEVTLSGGVGFFHKTNFALGDHDIICVYDGDAKYQSSQMAGYVTLHIIEPTATGLESNHASVPLGLPVTLTATVTPTLGLSEGGSGATPTGNVAFKRSGATLHTAAATAGVATFETTELESGDNPLTAHYLGDSTFYQSDSSTVHVTVTAPLTETEGIVTLVTLSASPNPVGVGSATRLTLTANRARATGTVTFSEGTEVLGTATMTAGVAHLDHTFALGSHTLTAHYDGDGLHAANDSNTLTVTVVNKTTPEPVFALSRVYGQTLALAVIINALDSYDVTGTVTFKAKPLHWHGGLGDVSTEAGHHDLGTVTVTRIHHASTEGEGIAVLTNSDLPVGMWEIEAQYSGDSHYLGSTAARFFVHIVEGAGAMYSAIAAG
jgi:large repetitive protein